MVGGDLMAKNSTQESFYEEVITKHPCLPKTYINSNIEVDVTDTSVPRDKEVKSAGILSSEKDHEEIMEDSENIYEIIPGDQCAPQNIKPCPMIRSFSLSSADRNKEGFARKTEQIKDTSSESNSVPSSPKAPVRDKTDDSNSTHYAEIILTKKVSDFIPSRPTRESENPILRQDFSGSLSGLPENLRNLHKHLTELSQDRFLEQRNAKSTPSKTPECVRKPNEGSQRLSKSVSPRHSPNHSPRAKESPGPLYTNMEFQFMEDTNSSRRSSACSSVSFNERQSLSSTEDASRDIEESPYENVKGLSENETGRPRDGSEPVDIVYSDLHFPEARRSKSVLEKTISSSVTTSQETVSTDYLRARSLPGQSSPKLPPRKNLSLNSSDPRPKSRSLGKLSGGALGFYVAHFVKRVTVQRSNAKTLQTTIHDIVSKTKVEDCSSVNVEVTSDMMRISTNCAPYEVIASFDVENIGCIDLFEQDHTTLGVLVCLPDVDAECYVIRCSDAQKINSAVKNAFNSSNSKTFKVPASTPVGPESWLGDDNVTTFTGISYLGSLKVKKSYLLINESITSLLEKAHPKEFKNTFVEVHSDQIRIADSRDSKIIHQHAIPWILLLGVYDQDTRLFGYIVSDARQGEKTRMICHAFRCSRITTSVAATEAIRLGCQATYSERRDSVRSSRRISFISNSSSGGSLESTSSSPSEHLDSTVEKPKSKPQSSKEENPKAKEKDFKKRSLKLKCFASMPHLTNRSSKKDKDYKMESHTDKNSVRTTSVSSVGWDDVMDGSWEVVEEEKIYNFVVTYLCSTVVNPPLRPKHLRECVKQYQKQQAKFLKKFGHEQPSNEVNLSVCIDGVEMKDSRDQKADQGMFFPFSSVSNVMAHPETPEYFAFATVVTGDSKHKCHLFQQTKIPSAEMIKSFQAFM